MRPELTGSAPEMRLNSVVLPAPLGPMSARRSPGRTARATPSTARSPPKCLLTPSSSRANSALMASARPRLVEAHGDDLLVLEVLGDPFPERMHGLAAVPAGPNHPLGRLVLGQVVGGHDRAGRGNPGGVGEGVQGVAGGGEEAARENSHVILIHELACLGERSSGDTFPILHDQLDLPVAHLAID